MARRPKPAALRPWYLVRDAKGDEHSFNTLQEAYDAYDNLHRSAPSPKRRAQST